MLEANLIKYYFIVSLSVKNSLQRQNKNFKKIIFKNSESLYRGAHLHVELYAESKNTYN